VAKWKNSNFQKLKLACIPQTKNTNWPARKDKNFKKLEYLPTMAKSKNSTYCKCAHDITFNPKHHTNLPWSMHKEKWQLTHTKLLPNDLQVTKLEATNSTNNLKMIRHGQDNVTNLKRKHMVENKTYN
jgi:hypothetical protein